MTAKETLTDVHSTSVVRAMINGFVLGHSSTTQPGLPALSSGEAELRAMTRAACDGLYVQEVLKEMGIAAELVLEGDATAALGCATKLSDGRVRHLKTADSFIKQLTKRKLCRLEKIGTKQNASDVLTKHVTNDTLKRFIPDIGYRRPSSDEHFVVEKLTPMNT